MSIRFVPRVSTHIGPFNVGVSAYPTRTTDPRRAYMNNDNRRRTRTTNGPASERPAFAPAPNQTIRTAQQYRQALQAHERAMASINAQAARDGVFFTTTPATPANAPATPWHMRPATVAPTYGTPSVHRAKMRKAARPATHKPFGYYLCVLVAMILGAFVSMGVLGMILTATHVLPATGASDTHTPRPVVSHSAPAHTGAHTTGGAVRK